AGMKMTHVLYRGAAPAFSDLIPGRVDCYFGSGTLLSTALLLWPSQPALAQFKQQGSKLVGSGYVGTPEQGYGVGLSSGGNTAVVGGPIDNNFVGAAWVFTRSGGAWSQQQKLVGTGAIGTAAQGHSVALSGDGNTVIAGGNNDNGGA